LLAQRVASAIVGVPIILTLIWFGGAAYAAAVGLALAVATIEFHHPRFGWLHPVGLLAAVLVGGVAAAAYAAPSHWGLWLAAALAIAPMAALVRGSGQGTAIDALWSASGVAYVAFFGSFLVLLRDQPEGRWWMYLAVLSTFAVDTAAYFTGRAIGRRPLAPRISPKKTVEGFLGGWAFGAIAVIVLAAVFADLPLNAGQAAVLGLLLPLAATAGDLLESGMKRLMRIKDASELIPGHGGVLDRFDSIFLTVPLVFLFSEFVV
jgi:phosphatidate cytidylyltransferase